MSVFPPTPKNSFQLDFFLGTHEVAQDPPEKIPDELIIVTPAEARNERCRHKNHRAQRENLGAKEKCKTRNSVSHEKHPGCLQYIGDYTTHLSRAVCSMHTCVNVTKWYDGAILAQDFPDVSSSFSPNPTGGGEREDDRRRDERFRGVCQRAKFHWHEP